MRWTDEMIADVSRMLRGGDTYERVARRFSVSRNAIAGLVNRTPKLHGVGGGKSKLSSEERVHRKKESKKRYVAKVRARPERKQFVPVVVSNNIPFMVQDWIAKNGVRRFEPGASADYYMLSVYLRERGWELMMKQGGNFWLGRLGGRLRSVSKQEAVELADKFRRSEGLEPFLAA